MNKLKKIIVLGIIITVSVTQFGFTEVLAFEGFEGEAMIDLPPVHLIDEAPAYWKIRGNQQALYDGPFTSVSYNPIPDNKREKITTTIIKYYWARIVKDLPQTDTCLSLLEQLQSAFRAQNEVEINRIKGLMAQNDCYMEIKNCITTKKATRKDIQQKITIDGEVIEEILGETKITEDDSCVFQEVYDYNELVKKFEQVQQWTTDCGKNCTTNHQQYDGAYLTNSGCVLRGHKYQSQEAGKGSGKAGGKGIGKAVLTIGLAALGQAWLAWSWVTFGSSGYGFSMFHLAYVWALMPAGLRTIDVDGGQLTLCWCPGMAVPKPEIKVIVQNCHSINLSIKTEGAETYSVSRNNEIIAADIPATQTTFTDTGLTPHTKYQYKVIAKSPLGTSLPATVEAYTFCLPDCSFRTDKEKIVFPGKATLSWQCQYAERCRINTTIGEDKGGLKDKQVNAKSGTLDVFPQEKTNFVLTCGNIDGEKNWTVSLEVLKPGIIEIKPQ